MSTSSIDLLGRGGELNRLVHVINVEIKDNHEEAAIAGNAILELCQSVRASVGSFHWRLDTDLLELLFLQIDRSSDVDEEMDALIQAQRARYPHPILHSLCYY